MPQAAIAPALELGLGGLGEIGNLSSGKQQAKAASTLANAQANELGFMQNYQNMLANMSPGQLNQLVSQLTQPLSANLATAVGGAVSPQLAAMGLGQSAGQMAQAMGTALAPYQTQEQQLGSQLALSKLSMPLAAGQSVLQATQNLPYYFQEPSGGAGGLLTRGLEGLLKKPGTAAGGTWPVGTPTSPGGIQLPTTTGPGSFPYPTFGEGAQSLQGPLMNQNLFTGLG